MVLVPSEPTVNAFVPSVTRPAPESEPAEVPKTERSAKAPLEMARAVFAPNACADPARSVPAVMSMSPPKVFVPERVSTPVPVLTSPLLAPLITPA